MATPARDPDAIKLFVGQISKQNTESDLRPLFESYGPIAEFAILRDKANVSKGCAFLTFVSRHSALACMEALHDKYTLPGIKAADSEQKVEERKLFIGMIAKSMTEDQLREMFSPYGTVEEVAILQTNGVSKGCAFVKMDSRQSAQRAIDALHAHATMEGCRHPIVVKFADTERDKAQKKGPAQQPFTPFTPYVNPLMMYQQMAAGMGAGTAAQMGAGMGGMGGMGGYDLSQAYLGMQQFAAPGAGYAQQPYEQAQFNPVARASKEGSEGPEGANLFIYHLPPEFNDAALAATFMPFGKIVSARVFVDKSTNLSKGFGFVSYDNAQSAQMAIRAMSGFQIGHKRLKVELKRPRGTPY